MNSIKKDDVHKVAVTPHAPAQIAAARYLRACAILEQAERAYVAARDQMTGKDGVADPADIERYTATLRRFRRATLLRLGRKDQMGNQQDRAAA